MLALGVHYPSQQHEVSQSHFLPKQACNALLLHAWRVLHHAALQRDYETTVICKRSNEPFLQKMKDERLTLSHQTPTS